VNHVKAWLSCVECAQTRGLSTALTALVHDIVTPQQASLMLRAITPTSISATWLNFLCKLLFGRDTILLRSGTATSARSCVFDLIASSGTIRGQSEAAVMQTQGLVHGYLVLSFPCILDQPDRADLFAESTRLLASWEVICVLVPGPAKSLKCPHVTSSHPLRVHVHVPAVVAPELASSLAVASKAFQGVPMMMASLIDQLLHVTRSLPRQQVVYLQCQSGMALYCIVEYACAWLSECM
jgi:hypothetical protein